MKKYIGTKTIEATPMTAGEASNLGFKTNGNGGRGYHVLHEGGYESWSPKDVFEKAYKVADTFKDRLVIERDDLKDKLNKLCEFIESPKFVEIVKDKNQRSLLIGQREFMNGYFGVLNERIKTIKD